MLILCQVSKHGVLGLMRCLRPYLLPTSGIRINAIAPLATATNMLLPAIREGLPKLGVPVSTAEYVGQIILGLIASSHKGKDGSTMSKLGHNPEGGPCNGLTIYIEGGRGWEIEEGLYATKPEWQGKEPSERLLKTEAWLASVSAKTKKVVTS